MKTLKLYLLLGLVLTVAVNMVVFDRQIASAAEASLVRIWSPVEKEAEDFRIDPAVLKVEKNTIVLWMSGAKGQEIQIVFESGKVCRDVTANPNEEAPDFFLDAKNCYLSTTMSYAETTALEFPEAGTFEYTVRTNDGKVKAKGKIVVAGD